VLASSSYTVQQGSGPLYVAAPGPLEHVTDPDGDNIYMVVTSWPFNGQLEPSPDGAFSYEPNAGFVGLDSFTFVAWDGDGWAPGTVTINVTEGARRCRHASLTNLACTCCVRVAGPMSWLGAYVSLSLFGYAGPS
jgi:hypothetical protein